jgi:hypothetical protein
VCRINFSACQHLGYLISILIDLCGTVHGMSGHLSGCHILDVVTTSNQVAYWSSLVWELQFIAFAAKATPLASLFVLHCTRSQDKSRYTNSREFQSPSGKERTNDQDG